MKDSVLSVVDRDQLVLAVSQGMFYQVIHVSLVTVISHVPHVLLTSLLVCSVLVIRLMSLKGISVGCVRLVVVSVKVRPTTASAVTLGIISLASRMTVENAIALVPLVPEGRKHSVKHVLLEPF